jgi:hypothetical protein
MDAAQSGAAGMKLVKTENDVPFTFSKAKSAGVWLPVPASP